MNWIFYSIISSIVLSFWNIITKLNIHKSINRCSLVFQYLCISVIINLIIIYIFDMHIGFEIYSFICGIFGGLAILCLTSSIYFSHNSGLSFAFLRIQLILTTILNSIFFNTKFDIQKLVNIIFIVIGSIIISVNEVSSPILYNNWIYLAILAGIFATVFDLIAKKALNKNDMYTTIFNCLCGELFILALINLVFIKHYKPSKSYPSIIVLGILYFLYTVILMKSFKLATNVGYVKAINTLSIILTIYLNYLLFNHTLSTYSWIGVLLIIVNIIYLITY